MRLVVDRNTESIVYNVSMVQAKRRNPRTKEGKRKAVSEQD
jgi:hypothetical protein